MEHGAWSAEHGAKSKEDFWQDLFLLINKTKT